MAGRRWSKCRSDLWNEELPEPLDYKPVVATRCGPDPDAVREAAKLLAKAKRPVHLRGPGRALGEGLEAAARSSPSISRRRSSPASKARARFPRRIALSLGSGGVAVPKPVRYFLDHADVIFGIGCSFTETSFGVPMPKGKTMIHATLDPDHLNKDIYADVGLIGDAGLTLDALIEEVQIAPEDQARRARRWRSEIADMRKAWLERVDAASSRPTRRRSRLTA